MLSVELTSLAEILDQTQQLKNVSQQAKEWSSRIHQAIWDTTVRPNNILREQITHWRAHKQVVNNIFAYETNGNSRNSNNEKAQTEDQIP
jgi:hypothetical protein